MKEKMLNNIWLKLMSVVAAILLWIIIINIYDPSTKVTINGVEIQFLNEQNLKNLGYSYEIEDDVKITVYVSGPRSIVSEISASDIEAIADLSNINVYSDYVDVKVGLKKTGGAYSAVEVAAKTTAVKISIENRQTKTFNIDAGINGTVADGYMVGDYQISPSTITITGAESLVNSIGSVSVNASVDGASQDIQTTLKVDVKDTDGKAIALDKLEMSRDDVDVKISVVPTKPIAIRVNGTPSVQNGYQVTSVYVEPESISITGDSGVIGGVSEIVIPARDIALGGAVSNTEVEIDINKYLPSGAKASGNGKIKVIVGIRAFESKSIDVAADAIKIENLSDDYKATVNGGITVTVTGSSANLAGVDTAALTPKIDLKDITEGTRDVEVALAVPDGCFIGQSYSVSVTVSKK